MITGLDRAHRADNALNHLNAPAAPSLRTTFAGWGPRI